MAFFSLEDKIKQAGGNPALMLREDPTGPYLFPFQEQFSNWRDEQTAWATTATLFDQSFHMNDIYFTGPDVKRLFSESAVNNFAMFGPQPGQAACRGQPRGRLHRRRDRVRLRGRPVRARRHARRLGLDRLPRQDRRLRRRGGGRPRVPVQPQSAQEVPLPAPGPAQPRHHPQGRGRCGRPHQVLPDGRVPDRGRADPRAQPHDGRCSRAGVHRPGDDRASRRKPARA